MGIIYKAVCPECDYQEEFYLGGGLFSMELLGNIDTLSEEEQKKIKQLEDSGEIKRFFIEKELTQCIHCKKLKPLEEKTIIKIMDKRGKTFIFGNYCSSCGNKLQIHEKVDENKDKLICPDCGTAFLRFDRVGRWD